MTNWLSRDEVEAQRAAQQQRRDIARLGAYAMHAKHDGKAIAARTMAARLHRYELQIDPTGQLKTRDPQALAKRVEAALSADMAKVRLARSDKRARVAEAKAAAQAREARAHALTDAAHATAREAAREALVEKIMHTSPDNLEQLATLVLALQAVQDAQAVDEQPF